TLPNQMPVSGYEGQGLVNSFFRGDGTTGTLLSPEFAVSRRYVSFLIGGGGFPGKTCMELLVEGKVVRSATGPNTQSGGSERLEPQYWDVAEFAGRPARLRIVDDATGGWGHINVDQIVLTDSRPAVPLANASRELQLRQRYLVLPVKNGAPKRRMSLVVDGRTAREFEIELADGAPDFRVFLDLAPFRGKTGVLRVDRLPEGSGALQAVMQADEPPGAEGLYQEARRPQFHFTSRRGWLNDPNGLVYSAGEWHLFYQHNPYGWEWGNMHWGHAVSRDLVHWRELPIALYPRQFGDWAFSGSAVVDRENTSGFRRGGGELLVAAYTSTGRGECIVYSNDRGRTWTEFAGNPVVAHEGRDPRLLWHAPSRRWVMAVYDEQGEKRYIAFYTSPDLKRWQYESRIEGFFECPELFELPVDGSDRLRKWVLHAADGKYVLGTFDGKEFHPEGGKHQLWWGNFYASQTWSSAPGGRRVQIGWGQGISFPGMPFNQQMTVPVELRLATTDAGVRLLAEPVRELRKLRRRERAWKGLTLPPGENPLKGLSGELWEIRSEWEPGDAQSFGFMVRGIPVTYDAARHELTAGRVTAPVELEKGALRLQVLVDRGSIEVFANGGRVAISTAIAPAEGERGLEALARGGRARLRSLNVAELASAGR
ncbi:MAG TPA: GH32 C-terminal domain-containing protein, partial [Armatimonadota bacterium]|nr:GH32 C-terminal domain-containing protein [Armatimonadota bacterium]